MRTFCLPLDPVAHGHEYNGHAQIAQLGDGVSVDEAGEEDGEQDAHGHDDGEDHRAEVLHGQVDEHLAHRARQAEQKEVPVDLRVLVHEVQRRCKLLR